MHTPLGFKIRATIVQAPDHVHGKSNFFWHANLMKYNKKVVQTGSFPFIELKLFRWLTYDRFFLL